TILTNEKYTGAAVYNVRRRGKYWRPVKGGEPREDKTLAVRQGRQRRQGQKTLPSERNKHEDLIVRPNAHTAIVSRELWVQCQRRLESRRVEAGKPGHAPYGGNRRGPSPWSLTGLCFCGRCAAVMWGGVKSTTKNGHHYVYRRLVCSTARRDGCQQNGCRTQTLEQKALLEGRAGGTQSRNFNPKTPTTV